MGLVGALHSLRSFRRRLPWALGVHIPAKRMRPKSYVLLIVCSTIVISQEQYVFKNCSNDAENP